MTQWRPELRGDAPGKPRDWRRALYLAGAAGLILSALHSRHCGTSFSSAAPEAMPAASRIGAPERAALSPGSSRDASGLARFSGAEGALPAGDSPIGSKRGRLVDVDHAHGGGTTHHHGEDGKALDGHVHEAGGEGGLSAAEILKNGSPRGKAFGQLAETGLRLDGAREASDEDAARR